MLHNDRFISFGIAAAIHLVLLFGLVFSLKTAVNVAEETPDIFKLADIREESPPPPLPSAAVSEALAENFLETDTDLSRDWTFSGEGDINFLPMHQVSLLPRFSEDDLQKRKVYPPIAQRAGIEGTVYLEIFVDNKGLVRSVSILKEDPPGRGFGEAAVKLFQGLKGSPASANGMEVAVRYRYPVRFSLK